MKYILLLLAIMGIIVSSLALREHYREYGDSPCSINEHWDCGVVNHSRFAMLGPFVPFPGQPVGELTARFVRAIRRPRPVLFAGTDTDGRPRFSHRGPNSEVTPASTSQPKIRSSSSAGVGWRFYRHPSLGVTARGRKPAHFPRAGEEGPLGHDPPVDEDSSAKSTTGNRP